MNIRYRGTIAYTIDNKHPDAGTADGNTHTFTDVYTFPRECEREDIDAYIKHDLLLVAGGGYNFDHIHDAKITITRA